jgi:hypothetical protein
MNSGDPGDRPLGAQAKATVRYAAVAAQVNVPAEGFFRQLITMDTF